MARKGFCKCLNDGGFNLYFAHGFKKLTCIENIAVLRKAILSPCRGSTLTVRPASNIKSYKNGVFSFTFDLDLFVLLEVSIRLMFIIRLKREELAELALWLRLELGLCCLPYERPKTRSTFFCSENTRTSSRSWRSCCSDYCTILPDSSNKGCA